MTDLPEPVLREGVYYPDPASNIGKVEDGFTATQMIEYRNAALEEAAKLIATTDLSGLTHYEQPFFANMLNQYAAAIRSLKGEVK